jgi:hypothetical protein
LRVEETVEKSPPVWGQVVNDLQLGLAFDEEKQAYAPGQEITLQIYARNTGNSEVPLSWADLSLKPPSVVPSKKLHIIKATGFRSGGGVYIMPNNTILLKPGDPANIA